MSFILYPKRWEQSTYHIDFEELYRQGYRGLIFDIDNTLVPHGAPADDRARALFEHLKKTGFQCCLLSNNKEPRVKMFNQDIGVHYIFDAHKLSKRNYLRACELMGTTKDNTVFIGDQIFTDILGANRAGLHNIMVGILDPHEEIQIVLKRYLEKPIMFFYRKKRR